MVSLRLPLAYLSLLTFAAGCSSRAPFRCGSDAGTCNHVPGAVCIASTNACAVPTSRSTCPSGLVYDDSAGSLAGTCVTPDGGMVAAEAGSEASVLEAGQKEASFDARPFDAPRLDARSVDARRPHDAGPIVDTAPAPDAGHTDSRPAPDMPHADMSFIPDPGGPPDMPPADTFPGPDPAGPPEMQPPDMSSFADFGPPPATWTLEGVPGEPAESWQGVYGGPSGTWVVGPGGVIAGSTDATTWYQFPVTTDAGTVTANLYGVWVDPMTSAAWAVGANGTALHWTGTGWTPTATGAGATVLHAVTGASATNVWASGGSGAFYHWTGTSWSPPVASSCTSASVTVYSMWDPPGAPSPWALGNNGTFGLAFVYMSGTWAGGMCTMAPRWFGVSGAAAATGGVTTWRAGVTGAGGGLVSECAGSPPSCTNTTTDTASTALQTLDAVWAATSTDIWAVGANCSVYHSTDGASFTKDTNVSSLCAGATLNPTFNAVWSPPGMSTSVAPLYVVGTSGVILVRQP